MSLRNTKVQITILLVLALCVGIYFWYTGLFQPLVAEKEVRSGELRRLQSSLEEAKRQAARRVSLQQEYEQLQEQWQVVETLLPKERDMADFIQQLHQIRGKVNATVERVSPLPPRQVGFYSENS